MQSVLSKQKRQGLQNSGICIFALCLRKNQVLFSVSPSSGFGYRNMPLNGICGNKIMGIKGNISFCIHRMAGYHNVLNWFREI